MTKFKLPLHIFAVALVFSVSGCATDNATGHMHENPSFAITSPAEGDSITLPVVLSLSAVDYDSSEWHFDYAIDSDSPKKFFSTSLTIYTFSSGDTLTSGQHTLIVNLEPEEHDHSIGADAISETVTFNVN